ncbi:DUF4041 domain-containing protein [Georgenia deserti]|uniref:DUF4041 domain-containing protein n=1 Tax=Georgenia deserti TaxID=2093781 RepID=A0ABW4L8A5_9MICO
MAAQLAAENENLRAELHRVGALGAAQIEAERAEAARRFELQAAELRAQTAKVEAESRRSEERAARAVQKLQAEHDDLIARIRLLKAEVVELEEEALLQEVGAYVYSHPLENAAAYKERLGIIRSRIKEMAQTDGGAIHASTNWTVEGSAAKGRQMVRQTAKLMLRAYNAEADALLRSLKPHRLEASIEKLRKTAEQIERNGRVMAIEIDDAYERLRVDELRLTADYLAKVEEEKEESRAAREALREQRKAEQEMERERAKLEKEQQHMLNALAALEQKGDEEAVSRMREQLADVERAIDDVDYRAANQRAGYVYVISNVGAFGERMVKVGMTRRLDPMDRVRELGDASVPFRFDVHALFFADDAVGIESELHRRMADKRVNLINLRREYFYATPGEVLEQLRDLAGEVLQFTELPEAVEFRQSESMRATA